MSDDAHNGYEVVYEDSKPVAVRIRLERRKGPDEWTTIDYADWPRVRGYRWSVHGSGKYAKSHAASGYYLHRFITRARGGTHVHHVDGDGFNNRRVNLEVLTPSEHKVKTYANGEIDRKVLSEGIRKAWANGTIDREAHAEAIRKAWADGTVDRKAHAEAVGRALAALTDDEVLEARRLYATGDWTYQQLADKYDVPGQTIYNAVTGRTYRWVPHVAHTTVTAER